MTENRETRGGKRKGAGRHEKADKKMHVSSRLPPDVVKYLKSTRPMSPTIERAVRDSDGFKRFYKETEK